MKAVLLAIWICLSALPALAQNQGGNNQGQNNNNQGQTVAVSLNVSNTGTVAGAEVVQLYVAMPSTAVPEPPKWLKGFQKISLNPGQTGQVQFTLNERSFSYWDASSGRWAVVPGPYKIMVASSSRDIRVQGQISIY